MKYLISFFFLVGCMLTAIFMETTYPYMQYLFWLAAILLFFQGLAWSRFLVQKKLPGELVLKRLRKEFRYSSMLFACYWTLALLIDYQHRRLLMALPFWLIVVFELEYNFFVRKHKPDGIAIDGHYIIFSGLFPGKRDLYTLNRISFNGFNNNITLHFTQQSMLIFSAKEFERDDLRGFLTQVASKCGGNIEVPHNLQLLLNMPQHAMAS